MGLIDTCTDETFKILRNLFRITTSKCSLCIKISSCSILWKWKFGQNMHNIWKANLMWHHRYSFCLLKVEGYEIWLWYYTSNLWVLLLPNKPLHLEIPIYLTIYILLYMKRRVEYVNWWIDLRQGLCMLPISLLSKSVLLIL